MSQIRVRSRNERGQGLAEYGMILSMIALIGMLALTFFGESIRTFLVAIANAL
jgi:Flp pilus assembly pilin Flp